MAKKVREIVFKPNYLFYWMLFKYETNKNRLNKQLANEKYPDGQKVTPVFVNLGGTRSSKTYDEIHLIYKVFTDMPNAKLRCIVYRETLVMCRKYTLVDFKDCFNAMKLQEGLDYEITGEKAGTPQIIIKGNVIDFMGYPEEGKQAGKCDIALINEILDSDNQASVDNILQRVTMFAMIDANPNKTVHFIYKREGWFNWFYSLTTYLDNEHLPEGKQGEYESKCPWMLEDSKIMVYDYIPTIPAGWQKDDNGNRIFFNGFRRRVWLKDECPKTYKDEPFPSNKYRAINTKTIDSHDEFWWKTMGEGLKASREGAIFDKVSWIDEFPKEPHVYTWYSMDFGYTHDPTVLAKTGYNKGKNLDIEILMCEPTHSPQITFGLVDKQLQKEAEIRKENGESNFDTFYIACESQDSYMGQNWVEELNNIAWRERKNYNFFKVKKTSISARVDMTKTFNLTLVEHKRLREEQINYVYLKIDGNSTNQPDPNSKFCDCWDAIGYGVIQFGHGLD